MPDSEGVSSARRQEAQAHESRTGNGNDRRRKIADVEAGQSQPKDKEADAARDRRGEPAAVTVSRHARAPVRRHAQPAP